MVRVAVIDDSLFMRRSLTTILEKDPDIKVVVQGRDGLEALDLIKKHNPDIITLDVDMPRMDGLTTLRKIMTENPKPVIMISSLTTEGAEITMRALELGAVDFIPKNFGSGTPEEIAKIEELLRYKVKTLAKTKLRLPRSSKSATTVSVSGGVKSVEKSSPRSGAIKRDLVGIGVSTGGPPAVQKILSKFSEDFPVPILIAQHMPAAFTGPFAKRLDNICAISVKEAEHGEKVKNGVVYIAPGGRHMRLTGRPSRLELAIVDEPKDYLYKPSVNVLMESIAGCLGSRALGVILTGMGSDGLEGIQALKKQNGRSLAQSEATCAVYGMPRAIIDNNLADEILDIDDMGPAILTNLYK